MKPVSKAEDFLKKAGMHPDSVDFGAFTGAFLEEMRNGLAGEPSSLLMLPTYLSADGAASEGDTAIAVDIGGTNLRIALTQYAGGGIKILESGVSPVPGLAGEITRDAFFREIALRLLPVIGGSGRIGVSFSHAAEILPDGDGRLISFSKEIRVKDAGGMEICAGLMRALRDAGVREKKSFVLLNDTTAVLLGGLAGMDRDAYDGRVGLVLGTGMNICYSERTAEIGKRPGGSTGDTMIVNTEAGCFGHAVPGLADETLDAASSNPGDHLLEKKTSGAYLGQLVLLTLQRAASEGLFSPGKASALLALTELPTPEVSIFLQNSRSGRFAGDCSQGGGRLNGARRLNGGSRLEALRTVGEDRETLCALTSGVVGRAAKLTAASLAAVIEKTGAGSRRDKPALVVAEGSTFHKFFSFRDKFDGYIGEHISRRKSGYLSVVTADNLTLLGASFAALTN